MDYLSWTIPFLTNGVLTFRLNLWFKVIIFPGMILWGWGSSGVRSAAQPERSAAFQPHCMFIYTISTIQTHWPIHHRSLLYVFRLIFAWRDLFAYQKKKKIEKKGAQWIETVSELPVVEKFHVSDHHMGFELTAAGRECSHQCCVNYPQYPSVSLVNWSLNKTDDFVKICTESSYDKLFTY